MRHRQLAGREHGRQRARVAGLDHVGRRMDLLLDDQVVRPGQPVHERLLVNQAGQAVLVDQVAAELADAVGDGLVGEGVGVVAVDVAPVLGALAELERPVLELLVGVAVGVRPLDAGLVEHLEVDGQERLGRVGGLGQTVHLALEGQGVDDRLDPLVLLDVVLGQVAVDRLDHASADHGRVLGVGVAGEEGVAERVRGGQRENLGHVVRAARDRLELELVAGLLLPLVGAVDVDGRLRLLAAGAHVQADCDARLGPGGRGGWLGGLDRWLGRLGRLGRGGRSRGRRLGRLRGRGRLRGLGRLGARGRPGRLRRGRLGGRGRGGRRAAGRQRRRAARQQPPPQESASGHRHGVSLLALFLGTYSGLARIPSSPVFRSATNDLSSFRLPSQSRSSVFFSSASNS